MPIRTVQISESTPEQRREYARTFLNLELASGDTDDTIAAKIAQAAPGSTLIFVNEPDTPADQAAQEVAEVPLKEEEAKGRQSGSLGRNDPRATIFINTVESLDGTGARDVVVGVNGRAWQLKRAHNLDVPWRVVEALKSAEADIVTHSQEPETLGEVQSRKTPRVAFQIISGPTQAEIDEWLERTGSKFCA